MRTTSQSNSDSLQKNNTINIEQLVHEHGQSLKQFIYRKLWDKQNVEDIFQTVVLEAIKSQHTFKAECHPKFWLMGIASNVIKNSARKNNAVFFPIEENDGRNLMDDVNQEWVEDPAATYERELFLDSIEDAYAYLPSEMKSVMYEVINNGKSYAETANELNIAIGTVRSRVSRARDLMRTRVDVH